MWNLDESSGNVANKGQQFGMGQISVGFCSGTYQCWSPNLCGISWFSGVSLINSMFSVKLGLKRVRLSVSLGNWKMLQPFESVGQLGVIYSAPVCSSANVEVGIWPECELTASKLDTDHRKNWIWFSNVQHLSASSIGISTIVPNAVGAPPCQDQHCQWCRDDRQHD